MNFFLHGHDFLGLQSQQVVHTLDILVVDLLQLGLSILLKILRQTVFDGLLQLLFDIATSVAYLNLGLLANLVTLLDQLLTTLLCGLRNAKTNDLAVVLGCDAHVAVHDGLLNVADGLLVPRTYGDGARIGHRWQPGSGAT